MKFRNTFVLSILALLGVAILSTETPPSSATTTQGFVVRSIFDEMSFLLASRADEYGVEVDISQAKLFQFGESPAIVAPITSFDIANLGQVGLLEVGGPFEVGDTMLPEGVYRLELSGNVARRNLMLNFRDEFDQRVASIEANEIRTLRSPRAFGGRVGADMIEGNPLNSFGLVGPTIGFNIVPQRRPPFVQEIHPCIGFLFPIATRFLSVGFCF